MRPPLNFVQARPTPLPINMRAPRRIGELGRAWAVQYSTGWTVYCRDMGVVSQGNGEQAAATAVTILLILMGGIEGANEPDNEPDDDPDYDEYAYGEPPAYWDRDRTEGA